MTKNQFTLINVLLLVVVTIAGCKKEVQNVKTEDENSMQTNSFFNERRTSCRLKIWDGIDNGGYVRSLDYNDRGLLEKWHEVNPLYDQDQLTTYSYDYNKKIASINYYDHGTLLYIVLPVYKFDRIVKELWYLADGTTLDDQVVNTYDRRGRLVKRESLNYDYYAKFQYDAIGNNTYYALKGTSDGFLYDSIVQAYEKPVREPMVAVPGLPYPIQYTNYIISQLKYTRYKEVYDDGTGNIVTGFEIDPTQSDLRAGPDQLAVYYKSFDIVAQVSYTQLWHYDNCNCDYHDFSFSDNNSRSPLSSSSVINKGRSPLITIKAIREMATKRKLELMNKIEN